MHKGGLAAAVHSDLEFDGRASSSGIGAHSGEPAPVHVDLV
jgi:hypothetical protein